MPNGSTNKVHQPLPKDPTGWKPVQLVPENARAGLGGFR